MVVVNQKQYPLLLLDDFWWEFEVYLSESGFPGFEDFQDVVG